MGRLECRFAGAHRNLERNASPRAGALPVEACASRAWCLSQQTMSAGIPRIGHADGFVGETGSRRRTPPKSGCARCPGLRCPRNGKTVRIACLGERDLQPRPHATGRAPTRPGRCRRFAVSPETGQHGRTPKPRQGGCSCARAGGVAGGVGGGMPMCDGCGCRMDVCESWRNPLRRRARWRVRPCW